MLRTKGFHGGDHGFALDETMVWDVKERVSCLSNLHRQHDSLG